MRKKLMYICVLLLLSLLIILTEYNKVPKKTATSYSQLLSPTETIAAVFSALSSGDTEQANFYLQEDNSGNMRGNRLFGNNLDDKGKEQTKELYQDLSYKDMTLGSKDKKTAIVNLTVILEGNETKTQLKLCRTNGYWQILMNSDFLKIMSSNSFPFSMLN